MENKKTYQADVERKRTTGFLLGLIVALALCFAALEYTTQTSTEAEDEAWLEDIAQDIEQLPAIEQKEMTAVVVDERPQPVITERVQEVKDAQTDEAQQAQQADDVARPVPITPVEVPQQMVLDPTAVPAIPLDLDNNPLKFRVVEDAPKPAQGWTELMKWLHKTLKYPPTARTQKIQGTVLVHFIVNTDGTIADIKVAKSADPLLDREALRVVRMMPKWEPAVKNGQPARAMVGFPIVFKL